MDLNVGNFANSLMQMLDTDQDDTLQSGELSGAGGSAIQQAFDKDGDGNVTKAEINDKLNGLSLSDAEKLLDELLKQFKKDAEANANEQSGGGKKPDGNKLQAIIAMLSQMLGGQSA